MGKGLKGGSRGGGGDGGIIEKVRNDHLDRSANSADGAKAFGGARVGPGLGFGPSIAYLTYII